MSDYNDVDAGHTDAGHDASTGAETSQEQFGEVHAHEDDERYVHVHHVEYDDGHGGHYEETEYVVYEHHEVDTEQAYGHPVAEADGAGAIGEAGEAHETFNAMEFLQERFTSEFSQLGERVGRHLGDLGHVGAVGHGSEYSGGEYSGGEPGGNDYGADDGDLHNPFGGPNEGIDAASN
jgi:hypothetical protein